jgi:hypothetical protein
VSKGDSAHKVRTLLALARNSLAACKNPRLLPKLAADVRALERRLAMLKQNEAKSD